MERSRNETKGKAPIIGVRVLCRESYVFLTGEMSTGTIGNCYGAPTRRYAGYREQSGTSSQKYFRHTNMTMHVRTFGRT